MTLPVGRSLAADGASSCRGLLAGRDPEWIAFRAPSRDVISALSIGRRRSFAMPRGHVFPDFRWIAHLRGEAGLTQDEVALRSGYGRRTISKIENGKPTTAPTLSAIATVLARSLGREVTLYD